MATLHARLFGKCSILLNNNPIDRLEGGKAQELFCYLLLHSNRPHAREQLASLLWGDSTTAQSKKYLRHALWQLQSRLSAAGESPSNPIIAADADWVYVRTNTESWIDVAVFEDVLAATRRLASADLDEQHARILRTTVQLYRGDLLEGWYYDWCLYDRERLQNAYLMALDKLMDYCEAHRQYDEGIDYGLSILGYDHARERTHRHLMRLYYKAGDRTGALRQYERCRISLDEELGVLPSHLTIGLYQQIRGDKLDEAVPLATPTSEPTETLYRGLSNMLERLYKIRSMLADADRQTLRNISAIELAIDEQRRIDT